VANADWREVYREERRRPVYVIENGRPDHGGCRAARLWLHIPGGDPVGAIKAPILPSTDRRSIAQ
jgi:hypothetical protein